MYKLSFLDLQFNYTSWLHRDKFLSFSGEKKDRKRFCKNGYSLFNLGDLCNQNKRCDSYFNGDRSDLIYIHIAQIFH